LLSIPSGGRVDVTALRLALRVASPARLRFGERDCGLRGRSARIAASGPSPKERHDPPPPEARKDRSKSAQCGVREFPSADDALSLVDVRVDSIAELTPEVVRGAARRSRSQPTG
jgi:hypothetical protein